MFRFMFQEHWKTPKAEVEGVEVGVCYGLNAFQCLISFPYLKMHLVDNYARNDSKIAKEASEYVLAPFEGRFKFHYKTSQDASKDFEDESIDFVYIDADHTYEAVKSDIRSWFPKVKIGGVIGGHDFYTGNVAKAKLKLTGNDVASAVARCLPGVMIAYASTSGDWWIVKHENTVCK